MKSRDGARSQASWPILNLTQVAPRHRALAAAAALERFTIEDAKEDAEWLPVEALIERLTSAKSADDRATLYLWHRYGGRRLEAERDARRQAGSVRSDHQSRAITTLGLLLEEVRQAFRDEKAIARAEAARRRALAFRDDITAKFRAGTLAGAAYEADIRRRFSL